MSIDLKIAEVLPQRRGRRSLPLNREASHQPGHILFLGVIGRVHFEILETETMRHLYLLTSGRCFLAGVFVGRYGVEL